MNINDNYSIYFNGSHVDRIYADDGPMVWVRGLSGQSFGNPFKLTGVKGDTYRIIHSGYFQDEENNICYFDSGDYVYKPLGRADKKWLRRSFVTPGNSTSNRKKLSDCNLGCDSEFFMLDSGYVSGVAGLLQAGTIIECKSGQTIVEPPIVGFMSRCDFVDYANGVISSGNHFKNTVYDLSCLGNYYNTYPIGDAYYLGRVYLTGSACPNLFSGHINYSGTKIDKHAPIDLSSDLYLNATLIYSSGNNTWTLIDVNKGRGCFTSSSSSSSNGGGSTPSSSSSSGGAPGPGGPGGPGGGPTPSSSSSNGGGPTPSSSSSNGGGPTPSSSSSNGGGPTPSSSSSNVGPTPIAPPPLPPPPPPPPPEPPPCPGCWWGGGGPGSYPPRRINDGFVPCPCGSVSWFAWGSNILCPPAEIAMAERVPGYIPQGCVDYARFISYSNSCSDEEGCGDAGDINITDVVNGDSGSTCCAGTPSSSSSSSDLCNWGNSISAIQYEEEEFSFYF